MTLRELLDMINAIEDTYWDIKPTFLDYKLVDFDGNYIHSSFIDNDQETIVFKKGEQS